MVGFTKFIYLLLTHGGDNGDKEVLARVEVLLDLLAHVTLRNLDIVLGSAVRGHKVKEVVVNVDLNAAPPSILLRTKITVDHMRCSRAGIRHA